MKFFFILIIFCLYTDASTFSISVCTTSSKEAANRCKEGILKDSLLDVFILQDEKDKYFRTYMGSFDTYKNAKDTLDKSSNYIKKQKPFIKKLENTKEQEAKTIEPKLETTKVSQATSLKEKPISIPIPSIKKQSSNDDLQFKKYLEEMKNLNTISKTNFKPISNEIINIKNDDLFSQIKNYDKLIVEVDSKKNIMHLKVNLNNDIVNIKSYKVSTAKTNVKKPQGLGFISSVSLKPQWYPTSETLKSFKQKGIHLPAVVPFGHKLNYMGAAKINLTHRVDGKEVYRIHGTLNESTIGTNESAGCIRMKNDEVVQLANLLNEFANYKDYSNIKVILK